MVYKFIDAPVLWFIVALLATWRISSIVHHEKIFSPFRRLIGVKEITEEDWSYPDTFIGSLIECFWCTSVWIGIATAIAMFLAPFLLIPFALSAFAIIINKYVSD
jgi:hypothetical protein